MFTFGKMLFVSALLCVATGSVIDKFEHWVHEFAVKFRDEHHWREMYQTWTSNDKFIEEVNFKNLSFVLGHNQFSGMNSAEFKTYLGYSNGYTSTERSAMKSNLRGSFSVALPLSALPVSVDWIEKGAVTPVKDQGQCGSCWSFSTTGALEGAYFTKFGELPSFSEQQLVDCDMLRHGGKDHGCNGGLMDNAFEWIEKNGGLCVEFDYPYVSGETQTNGDCQKTCTEFSKSQINSYVDVMPSSDAAMMTALSLQPVAVAIEADQREFQLYKSGVFTGACGTNLDHGVLVVGYGTLSGDDYYMVKNSWSTSWGANGYILFGRGPQYNNGDGQCGVLLEASYPVL